MNHLSEEEVIKHLNISMLSLHNMVKDNLVLLVENEKPFYPMFQFNGEALDLRVISVFQVFKKNGISSEIICEWFETYNETLENTPAKYIKLNGADQKIKAVANLASDIFLL